MSRIFGTDGVRGLANGELLTPELAVALSASAARVLAERDRSRRPLAVVGRDPRASGEMLEAAVVAGLASAGADAVRIGVLPTPAVAYLVGQTGADLGIMLSASHNPMPDNGIKLFAPGGQKLPDELEQKIEAAIADGHGLVGRPTGAGVGSTPTRTTLAPALVSPATTAASSISPLARGSRPTIASGWWLASLSMSTRAAATATDRASSGVSRSPFASPRTPSVPKSRPMAVVPFAGPAPVRVRWAGAVL